MMDLVRVIIFVINCIILGIYIGKPIWEKSKVVKCKNCFYYGEQKGAVYCKYYTEVSLLKQPDDFCSRGQLK